jgi:hypothetical protein
MVDSLPRRHTPSKQRRSPAQSAEREQVSCSRERRSPLGASVPLVAVFAVVSQPARAAHMATAVSAATSCTVMTTS